MIPQPAEQEALIAPCGMNCALCRSYQAQQYDLKARGFGYRGCPGCNPRGQHCLHMRDACEIVGKGQARFCYECDAFPCPRLRRLDSRYRAKYHMSMIENLLAIRDTDMAAFLAAQQHRWRCAACGDALLCCHNGLCLRCDLAVLQDNRRYRWGEADS